MTIRPNFEEQTDLLTLEPKLDEPPLYEVILLNDDYTTMDFVVGVLKEFFHKSEQEAQRLMLAIHELGEAVCAICPREIAETRVEQVIGHARAHNFPLMCVMRLH